MVDQLPVISGSASASLSGGGTLPLRQSGTLSFSDPDAGDLLVVSIISRKLSYTSASGVDQSGLLTADQIARFENAFVMPVGALDANSGSATWNFSIGASQLAFLGRLETLTLTTTVQVDDQHGGITTKDVVITLHGTNDAPVFAPAPLTATSAVVRINETGARSSWEASAVDRFML